MASQAINWIELEVTLPDDLDNWVDTHVKPEDVKERPKPHITLLYGFDPARFAEVEAKVKTWNITAADYTFGKPRLGYGSPVILVPIVSDKLQACFWDLHCTFPNEHTLVDGKFSPHVTLCWLHK